MHALPLLLPPCLSLQGPLQDGAPLGCRAVLRGAGHPGAHRQARSVCACMSLFVCICMRVRAASLSWVCGVTPGMFKVANERWSMKRSICPETSPE